MPQGYDELAQHLVREAYHLIKADLKSDPPVHREYYSPQQASIYTGDVSVDHLQEMRSRGIGPKWTCPRGSPRIIRYKREWLDDWLMSGQAETDLDVVDRKRRAKRRRAQVGGNNAAAR